MSPYIRLWQTCRSIFTSPIGRAISTSTSAIKPPSNWYKDRPLPALNLSSSTADVSRRIPDTRSIPSAYKEDTRYPHIIRLEEAKKANLRNPNLDIKITDSIILDFIERHPHLLNPNPNAGPAVDGGVGGRQGRNSRALEELEGRRKLLYLDI